MDSRTRSLLKALSWRFVALAVTSLVGFVVTGSLAVAASIGLADSAIKIFVYYAHERTWENVSFGRGSAGSGRGIGRGAPVVDARGATVGG